MLPQVLPGLPAILRGRSRLLKQYGSAFPRTSPLFPMRDRLNLVFTARDLQRDTPIIDESFRFVGPSIDPNGRGGEFPLEAMAHKPVIYISLGTVHAAPPTFLKACFEAFSTFPAQFVLSAGKAVDHGALGQVPTNFIVRDSVPQLRVLEHSDLFITHAGINGVHEGLYYGVPLVMIPHQLEQLLNARCVSTRGAGIILETRLRGRSISAALSSG